MSEVFIPLKVLLLGHSYVRDLAETKPPIRSIVLNNGFRLNLSFFSIPGATIPELLLLNSYLPYIKDLQPDIIILVIGGNDLKHTIQFHELKNQFQELCLKLQNLPGIRLVVGTEVEQRWGPSVPNQSHWSKIVPYSCWSTVRNTINKHLKKFYYTDGFVWVVGPNKLNFEGYFDDDGVHLNVNGRLKYLELIGRSVKVILFQKKLKLSGILLQNYNLGWDTHTVPFPKYNHIGKFSGGVELDFFDRIPYFAIPRLLVKQCEKEIRQRERKRLESREQLLAQQKAQQSRDQQESRKRSHSVPSIDCKKQKIQHKHK